LVAIASSATIDNIDLETLEPLISELISEAEKYYRSSDAIRTILNRFGKSSYLHNKNSFDTQSIQSDSTQIVDVLSTFELKFKQPLINYLREYYRLKYNPELTFDGLLLEEIGFKPCYRCFDSEFIADFEKRAQVRLKLASGIEASIDQRENSRSGHPLSFVLLRIGREIYKPVQILVS